MVGQRDRQEFRFSRQGKKKEEEVPSCWGSRRVRQESCRRQSNNHVRAREERPQGPLPDWVWDSKDGIEILVSDNSGVSEGRCKHVEI